MDAELDRKAQRLARAKRALDMAKREHLEALDDFSYHLRAQIKVGTVEIPINNFIEAKVKQSEVVKYTDKSGFVDEVRKGAAQGHIDVAGEWFSRLIKTEPAITPSLMDDIEFATKVDNDASMIWHNLIVPYCYRENYRPTVEFYDYSSGEKKKVD